MKEIKKEFIQRHISASMSRTRGRIMMMKGRKVFLQYVFIHFLQILGVTSGSNRGGGEGGNNIHGGG